MKIAKLFLLITLTLTASLNAEMGATINSGQTSQNIERDVQKYEEAVMRILNTQPTTLGGDLGREFVAMAGALVMGCVGASIADKDLFNTENNLVKMIKDHRDIFMFCITLFYPIFRVLFDKKMRKTNILDKNMDILISKEELNLKALSLTNIDLDKLEEKIQEHGNKNEFLRWIIRVGLIFLPGFFQALAVQEGIGKSILTSASLLASAFLCFYVFVMQSATFQKISRMEKLSELKILLAQAKKTFKQNKTFCIPDFIAQ